MAGFWHLNIWIAFTLASVALLAVPGPTVHIVVIHVLTRGRSVRWPRCPGLR